MSTLYCLFTIADRARLPEIVSLYRETGIRIQLIALGRGTAAVETLSLLGLERTEKAVILAPVTGEVWRRARRGLERRVRIDVPGTGIAFVVPVSAVAGRRELAFLAEGQGFQREEESELKGTDHELLVAVCNQGHSETVMDAARAAGAGGGTVLHARGTGMERAERFLGISLASEKDIVFIVTRSARRDAIMEAVARDAGTATAAGTIVFSLPVTDTAGLRLAEEDEETREETKEETP